MDIILILSHYVIISYYIESYPSKWPIRKVIPTETIIIGTPLHVVLCRMLTLSGAIRPVECEKKTEKSWFWKCFLRRMLETGDKSRVRILARSAFDKIFDMLRNLNVNTTIHNVNLWIMIYILDHPSFFRAIIWTDKHHQRIPSGHYFSWVNYP